jgi:hypothetical protein
MECRKERGRLPREGDTTTPLGRPCSRASARPSNLLRTRPHNDQHICGSRS